MFRLLLFMCALAVQTFQPIDLPVPKIESRTYQIAKQYNRQPPPWHTMVCTTYVSQDPSKPAILTLCDVE
jgi:hypothetical protein